MAVGGLLTLDLGTRTGWLHAIGAGFDTGVAELGGKRGDTNGPRFLKFEAFLEKRVEKGVELIAYEQVLTKHKSVAQASMAHGLVAVLEKVAAKHGVEIVSVHTGTLKKFATGDGNAKKPTMTRVLIDRWPQLQGRLVLVKPSSVWIKQHTHTSRPARKAVWVKCPEHYRCEHYVCRKHTGKHVHDCNCPEAPEFEAKFGFSPYGQPKFKGEDPELVADLERVTVAGKVPDDNQVDAAWVARWACETYAIGSNPFVALEACRP